MRGLGALITFPVLFWAISLHAKQAKPASPDAALEIAYDAASKLSGSERLDFLTELAPVAARAGSPQAETWVKELERLAGEERDACRQARGLAFAIRAWSFLNADLALAKLGEVKSGCPAMFQATAADVFRKSASAREVKVDAMIAAARNLAEQGEFPFRGIGNAVMAVSTIDKLMLLREAIASYVTIPPRTPDASLEFLVLLESPEIPLPEKKGALEVVLRRLSEGDSTAEQSHVTYVTGDQPATFSATARAAVKLLALAEPVDRSLAEKIKAAFPGTMQVEPDHSESGMVTRGGVPTHAPFPLQLQQMKLSLGSRTARHDLDHLQVPAVLQAAYLAQRAVEARKGSDMEQALHWYREAQAAFSEAPLQDEEGRLRAMSYIAEAAVAIGEAHESQARLEQLLALASSELSGERKNRAMIDSARVPFTSTVAYAQINRVLQANQGNHYLFTTALAKLEDPQLRAFCFLAMANAEAARNGKSAAK